MLPQPAVSSRAFLGGLDVDYARRWPREVGRELQLDRALELAESIRRSS